MLKNLIKLLENADLIREVEIFFVFDTEKKKKKY